MSVVSVDVSLDNPITEQHVLDGAAELGISIDDAEMPTLRLLLAAAHDTFQQLSALPDDHPDTDTERFPRRHVRRGAEDDRLGFPWAYRFSISDAEPSRAAAGLLAGMNVVVKDNICVAQVPQMHGTDCFGPWTPEADATVVRRIVEAGAQLVGTATCEALSCATFSNTAADGPVYNPWAKGYSAGGSSSGVAALVGSQTTVHMGMGADQGGSIRVPAAFCGLVGLKATHGLIPYTGIVSCEPVMDHVGPMCRTVWDTALLLEAVAGRDGVDDRQGGGRDVPRHGEVCYSTRLDTWFRQVCEAGSAHHGRPLLGRKMALVTEGLHAPFMHEDMKRELHRVRGHFEALGATVEAVSIPGHVTGRALWMAACRQSLTSVALGHPAGRQGYYLTELQDQMLPWTQDKWDRLPVGMKNELINGLYEKKAFPSLYGKVMNLANKLKREYDAHLDDFDVLLMPSVPFTAPPLLDRQTASPMDMIRAAFGQTMNTMQFNLTGHPAMTLPTGLRRDMSGTHPDVFLPVSVQLVGPLHGEEALLQFGYAYEQAFDWKTRVEGES